MAHHRQAGTNSSPVTRHRYAQTATPLDKIIAAHHYRAGINSSPAMRIGYAQTVAPCNSRAHVIHPSTWTRSKHPTTTLHLHLLDHLKRPPTWTPTVSGMTRWLRPRARSCHSVLLGISIPRHHTEMRAARESSRSRGIWE
jgi:hypothetical protein